MNIKDIINKKRLKQTLTKELFRGIDILEKENPSSKRYYEKMRQFIRQQ